MVGVCRSHKARAGHRGRVRLPESPLDVGAALTEEHVLDSYPGWISTERRLVRPKGLAT